MEIEYTPVSTHQTLGTGRVLLGFIFSVLGFFFFFVSFVIPQWNSFDWEDFVPVGLGPIQMDRIGLWQNCKMYGDYDCVWNTGIPGIVASQVSHCLACILFVVYWVCVVRWWRQNKIPIRLLESAFCAFAIGICLMISFLAWITLLGTPFQRNLSFGFIFAIFSFVLMELTFVILFMESKEEARKRKPPPEKDTEESSCTGNDSG